MTRGKPTFVFGVLRVRAAKAKTRNCDYETHPCVGDEQAQLATALLARIARAAGGLLGAEKRG